MPLDVAYSYLLPEVRPLLHEVERALPDTMWLSTTPADEVRRALEPLFDPHLEIPARADGTIDLDGIHEPIIDRILDVYEPVAPGLKGFEYRYPLSGSSEGLFHLLARERVRGAESVYLLAGDYVGFASYADQLGLRVDWVDPDRTDLRKLRRGVWFISNPSGRLGNVLPDGLVNQICDLGHSVVLDLAYAGGTADHVFDASHRNIRAAVMSFSKSYGVLRQRVSGFVFAREELGSLDDNRWAKDTLRLMQALKLAEEIGPRGIHPTYGPIQGDIVDELNDDFGLGLRVSDFFLFAHLRHGDSERLDGAQRELISGFRRATGYRFCLTPYFEIRERATQRRHGGGIE
jgi:hypothetical protein